MAVQINSRTKIKTYPAAYQGSLAAAPESSRIPLTISCFGAWDRDQSNA